MKVRTPISDISRCRGFTLLELLLVCALVALAAGLVSSFLSGEDQKQFAVDQARISAQLRNARRQAIITGSEQGVKLATAIAEPESPDSPPAVPPNWLNQDMQLKYAASLDDTLEETAELDVIFFPMGSSTGGLIELSDGVRETYFYVSPLTGKFIEEARLRDLEERVQEDRVREDRR